jgi:hypothetical protein
MWGIKDFKKWTEKGRPINKNIMELNISYLNIKTLGNLENLVSLEKLKCDSNELTSLEGIEKLVNLKELDCYGNKLRSLEGIENLTKLQKLYFGINQLTSLEGIENLVKLIKNNKNIINDMSHNFIDSNDYIELNNLFVNLIKCKNNNRIDKYIDKIEQMIKELNGFQNYVLK